MKKSVSIVRFLLWNVVACHGVAAFLSVMLVSWGWPMVAEGEPSGWSLFVLAMLVVMINFLLFLALLRQVSHRALSQFLRGVHHELRHLSLQHPEIITPNPRWKNYREYSRLISGINRIIESLLVSRRALLESNSALEQRINEKTAELRDQNLDLIKLNQQLSRLANTDALTQVYNRTRFDQLFQEHVEVALRRGTDLAFLLIDLDDFKKVNDVHGHQIGDRVLKHSASCISRIVSDKGIVARWGGEEFAVILPYYSLELATEMAEALRAGMADSAFQPQNIRVTTSIGVAQLIDHESGDDLLSRADEALYRAKGKGRNQVIMASA